MSKRILMETAYTGEPRDDMENAIEAVVESFGGEMADSGWCCDERDTSAEFPRLHAAQRFSIEQKLKAIGCIRVDWSHQ